MATAPVLTDDEASPEARAVFEEIRAARGSDFINNFWRVLAHDPALMRATWERLRAVMGPDGEDGLDPLTKELVYMAVSTANGCSYCVHSHTAAARAKGMTDAQYASFLAVVALAHQTNALATALQISVDPVFDADQA